ncbi:DUF2891 family protein [Streptomyces lydicus]|nr:DUF2891 family protein [Streptomyces lydicus]
MRGSCPGPSAGPRRAARPAHRLRPRRPQIGHLVGLSLSRAAALRRIAAALPGGDPRTAVLEAVARDHLVAGLPHCVSGTSPQTTGSPPSRRWRWTGRRPGTGPGGRPRRTAP